MNNYDGYLLKFGSTALPAQYIEAGTYKATPKQRQDLDPYTDGDGALHRSVMTHDRTKITFTLLPLDLDEKIAVQAIWAAAMSNTRERKVSVTYWDDEGNDYATGDFYMPDIEFPVDCATESTILYQGIPVTLIEY